MAKSVLALKADGSDWGTDPLPTLPVVLAVPNEPFVPTEQGESKATEEMLVELVRDKPGIGSRGILKKPGHEHIRWAATKHGDCSKAAEEGRTVHALLQGNIVPRAAS